MLYVETTEEESSRPHQGLRSVRYWQLHSRTLNQAFCHRGNQQFSSESAIAKILKFSTEYNDQLQKLMVHIPALLADFFIPHSHLSLDVPWSECMCSPCIPIEGSNSSPACLIRSFLYPFIRLVAVALNLIGWSLPVETACRLHSCWSGWILPWWLHQCMYAQGKSLEALLEKCLLRQHVPKPTILNIMPRM